MLVTGWEILKYVDEHFALEFTARTILITKFENICVVNYHDAKIFEDCLRIEYPMTSTQILIDSETVKYTFKISS